MIPIKTDSHVHSTFSVDGKDDIKKMCDSALERGIKYITFTEHLDFNPLDEGYNYFRLERFLSKIEELNNLYSERLKIFSGVEFSEPYLYPEHLKEYNNYDLDIIIGAIHWVEEYYIGDEKLLEIYDRDEIFLKYYDMVYEAVSHKGFDVLAHFDFPKRYLDYDYKNIDLVAKIIKLMIENDIILEINTSSLRKGYDNPMPSEWLLEIYRDKGGKYVTVGSDAHQKEDIAEDFDKVHKLIQKLDLIPVYFKNRKLTTAN